jgi:hypothetical protein
MFASFARRMQSVGARSFSALVVKEISVELPSANTGMIVSEFRGRKALICQPARNPMQSGLVDFYRMEFLIQLLY